MVSYKALNTIIKDRLKEDSFFEFKALNPTFYARNKF